MGITCESALVDVYLLLVASMSTAAVDPEASTVASEVAEAIALVIVSAAEAFTVNDVKSVDVRVVMVLAPPTELMVKVSIFSIVTAVTVPAAPALLPRVSVVESESVSVFRVTV